MTSALSAAHLKPAAWSNILGSSSEKIFTGTIFTFGAIPATPILLCEAAIIPAQACP
jgi:hypothetical protein